MSVSQRIFSTVCNHGNHKDVALTIIGSDGILKDTTHNHAHRKSPSHDQSKGKVIQLASSKLRWDFATLICCCKKKLFCGRWAKHAGSLLTHLLSPLLSAKQQLHKRCSSSICYSRATWPVYFMAIYSPRLKFLYFSQTSSLLVMSPHHQLHPPNIKPLNSRPQKQTMKPLFEFAIIPCTRVM